MDEEPTIIICWRHVVERKVEKQKCPTCKSEQDFLCEYEEWYGWTEICLNCGDCWMDGEMCPRPFRRGWRKEAIEDAKSRISKPVEKRTLDFDNE